MKTVLTDDRHYTNIANKIREKTGGTTKYKPSEMPSGLEEVFEAGKQAEYDAFWNVFQREITDYTQSQLRFAGKGWNDATFSPKNNIVPLNSAYGLFWSSEIVDIKGILERNGVVLDLSQATVTQMTFYNCYSLKYLGVIDISNSQTMSNMFGNDYELTSIDTLVLSEKMTDVTTAFGQCRNLEKVIFRGTLACSGLDLQHSTKLNKVSIQSLIAALSTTASGKSVTLSKTAVNNAFATSAGAANGSTSAEWTALVGTRSNWTISLV